MNNLCGTYVMRSYYSIRRQELSTSVLKNYTDGDDDWKSPTK